MDSNEQTEKENLQLLFVAITRVGSDALRALFKRRWKALNGYDWPENPQSAENFKKLYKPTLQSYQKELFATGTSLGWDISMLRQLLKVLTPAVAPPQYLRENKAIEKIADLRNSVAHSANGLLSNEAFNKNWSELEEALRIIEGNLEQLRAIKTEQLENSVLAEATQDAEMIMLKEQGNKALKEGCFDQALTCYSNALLLRSISLTDKAVLLSNRSQVYIKQAQEQKDAKVKSDILEKAFVDAKMAQSLLPTWFRPYSRKGQIQYLQEKYEKSVSSYDYALILSPKSSELKDARDISLNEQRRRERFEHLNKAYMPQSSAVDLEQTGLGLTNEKVEEMLNTMEATGEPMALLVRAHQARDGTPPDYKKAIMLYTQSANKGNAEAMYNLGVLISKGIGVPIDCKQSVVWWQKAAALPPLIYGGMNNVGVSNSQHALGLSYLDGIGVDKDTQLALHFFNKAAGNGYPGALNTLGSIYQAGKIVPKDMSKALQYYHAAAAKGEAQAMHNIAGLYVVGLGVTKDLREAIRWYEKAARKGYGLSNIVLNENREHWEQNIMKMEEIQRKYPVQVDMLKDFTAHKTDPRYITFTKEDPYPYDELQLYAKTSRTAARMFKAKQHYVIAMGIYFENKQSGSLEQSKRFVEELAKAFAITELVVILPQEIFGLLEKLVQEFPTDSNALLCLVATSPDHEKIIKLIKTCTLRKISFPRMHEFLSSHYSFLSKWPEALEAINKAIEIAPEQYDLLYSRAFYLRFMERYSDSRAEYEQYLRLIDPDDRKVPEAYYGISLCIFGKGMQSGREPIAQLLLEEAKKYFEIGKEKEANSLPFFNRKPSDNGIMLNKLFALEQTFDKSNTSGQQPLATSSTPSVPSAPQVPSLHLKFSDPRRIELITKHREWFVTPKSSNFTTASLPKKQKMPASLTNLQPLYICDIDLTVDKTYIGYCLTGVILDRLSYSTGSYTVLEDEKGGVERVGFYNFSFKNEKDANKFFWIGKRISIIDPYLRQANDGMPYFRVDDPASVISHSHAFKDVCALCLTESTKLMACAKCKKTKYCSKECQATDWKVYEHKKLCH